VVASADGAPGRGSGFRTLLWVLQALLALFFAAAGYSHGLMPLAEAAEAAPWIANVPPAFARFVGMAELAGAAGLILPAATRIAPWLTTLAAALLALLMLLAALFHLMRGEPAIIPMHVIAGTLAVIVAWGRWRQAPIPKRA